MTPFFYFFIWIVEPTVSRLGFIYLIVFIFLMDSAIRLWRIAKKWKFLLRKAPKLTPAGRRTASGLTPFGRWTTPLAFGRKLSEFFVWLFLPPLEQGDFYACSIEEWFMKKYQYLITQKSPMSLWINSKRLLSLAEVILFNMAKSSKKLLSLRRSFTAPEV